MARPACLPIAQGKLCFPSAATLSLIAAISNPSPRVTNNCPKWGARPRGRPPRVRSRNITLVNFHAIQEFDPMPISYRGRAVLRLNAVWAVSDDGKVQWFLLRRAGANWHPRRYHVERESLLRSIAELCGSVDSTAAKTIRAWPLLHCSRALAER